MPSPAQVDRLAHCSGGRARDFVRLIRAVIEETGGTQQVVTDAMVDEAIDGERRTLERGLNAEQIATLEQVAADPHHRLPAGEIALHLLDENRLLAYPNQSTWYHPHPLLMLSLIRRPGSPPS